MDIALLVLRLVVGLYLFGHGSQKLFGWFGGYGLKGTAGFFGSALGFRPAGLWTLLAGLSEAGGGLLMALGFLSPLGPLGVAAAMLVAIFAVHWPKGVWAQNGGYELPLTNLAAAVALALTGPGAVSLDAALGIALPEPLTLMAGSALALLGVVVALATRQQPAQSRESAVAA